MSSIPDIEQIYATFLALASNDQTSKFNIVGCLTWIVYDIMICFDQEVELIWKERWTLPKVLYILSRYAGPIWLIYECVLLMTPATSLSALTCRTDSPLTTIVPILLWIIADLVMLLRIRALYLNNKKLLYSTFVVWVLGAGVIIYFLASFIAQSGESPAPPPFENIAGCIALSLGPSQLRNLKYPPIIIMTVNVWFLALTLNKFRENHIFHTNAKVRLGSLLKAFIVEGVFYFVGFVLVMILDLVTDSRIALSPFAILGGIWVGAFYSYAGSHLILHLRAVRMQSDDSTTLIHKIGTHSSRFHSDQFTRSWIGDLDNGGL